MILFLLNATKEGPSLKVSFSHHEHVTVRKNESKSEFIFTHWHDEKKYTFKLGPSLCKYLLSTYFGNYIYDFLKYTKQYEEIWFDTLKKRYNN